MSRSDKKNPLEVADEELMELDFPQYETEEEPDEDTSDDLDTGKEEEDTGDEPVSDVSEEEESDTTEEESVDDETDQETEEETDQDESTEEEETPSDDSTEEELDEKDEDDKSEQEEETDGKSDSDIDYKAEYEKLLAPFRANGKDMRVENVDEAITLMQMGANYNKKMAALKPNLKLMKMLDNEKLLDEGKLSHLIDLSKRDPEAIAKLIKDSGIDPLDLDLEKSSEYKPNTYTVDDKEVELDSILQDIEGTPGYDKTIDVISNKWDENSRRVLVQNPSVIKVINDHMSREVNGSTVYDTIDAEVSRLKALGQLSGLSDIEAYKTVGDKIFAQGQPAGKQAPAAKPIKPKAKKAEDPTIKQKRKAAGPTKSKPSTKDSMDFNPLDVADDEIEKMSLGKFI